MKGGKGNTFSTSLNKSFFLSFSRHRSYVSSLLRKSINCNSLLKIREKGGQMRASKRICARDRSCNANRHTCRRSTCNKVENDLVNETQDNE
jgi:hypothetical protein